MKYSINSAGRIVAERDIYSLGGFIPKGRLGGFIADETQLSQEGECWLDSGDISARPDVRIKDNAFIGGFFRDENPVHTDIVTEFSGNTLIPGNISVRSFATDTKNNVFIKDSFIGVSMDVLCGPRTTTTAFPFEQGGFNKGVPAGTLFISESMRTGDANICRTTANLCLGKDTYLYIPTGYNCRVLWGYWNTAGQLAYSGDSFVVSQALTKLEHPIYKMAMVHVSKINGTAMTPADLLATGVKILGHISGSANVDIRPESASGQYVMNNSYLIVNTSNFGLAATQKRILAGGLFNSTMYTPDGIAEYKIYGTFHNVQRLEYAMYLSDSHRTNANRDTYISAYDCPLLRVDNGTYDASLTSKGNLTLRRCIVPKAMFTDNIHNGNVYEDTDFSYTSDHLGAKAGNNYGMWSSHKQGEYAAIGEGTAIAGLISRPENLAAGSILGPGVDSVPLDGSLLEQGAYGGGSQIPYESAKSASTIRIRTGKPVKTAGLIFPSLPAGYSVKAFYYLDEDFIIRSMSIDPTGLDATYPYVVMLFRRDDDSSITVADFIALGLSLRITNYSNVPEITGSSYVGAGCAVRGDVKLIGDPYVNRVSDVNMWERGTMGGDLIGKDYESGKARTGAGNRFRFVDSLPVEPGDIISCAEGYFMYAYWYDGFGVYSSQSNWNRTFTVTGNDRFLGIVLKKATAAADAGGLIEDSDIPLANVRYVRAFKKRRYIVNELDRTSPEDILLSVDYWEQGTAGGGQADAGKTYEELKATSGTTIRLKRPINVSPISSISSTSGFSRYIRVLDAVTKFHLGESLASAKMALLATIIQKDPSAAINPSEIPNSRLVLEFVPQPRIIVPYGVSNVWIEGTKVRMYDNSVISRTITKGMGVILKGDAVMGSVFTGDVCMCSNGHGDAIINK